MSRKSLSFLFKPIYIAVFVLVLTSWATSTHAANLIITWSAVSNASGYNVYIGDTSRYSESFSGYNYRSSASSQSPFDAKNETTFTTSLSVGTYYLAITAYNKYGESGYSEELSLEAFDNECISGKISASAKLVKTETAAYANWLSDVSVEIASHIGNAEQYFEANWDKVEFKSVDGGIHCPSAAATAVEDTVLSAVDDIVTQISGTMNLEDVHARRLAKSLLVAAGDRCSSLLLAEGKNIKKSNPEKLQQAKNIANQRFALKWDKAIAAAETKGITYVGASASEIEALTDRLVTDVLSHMGF